MCRSAGNCLLLKQTRHLSLTGPELHHHTPWNLKPDAGSWAARVIRGTHHAGGVTVWLRCPIRHTANLAHTTQYRHPGCKIVLGGVRWPGDLSIGACMAPVGPAYKPICRGSSNSLKSRELWC